MYLGPYDTCMHNTCILMHAYIHTYIHIIYLRSQIIYYRCQYIKQSKKPRSKQTMQDEETQGFEGATQILEAAGLTVDGGVVVKFVNVSFESPTKWQRGQNLKNS